MAPRPETGSSTRWTTVVLAAVLYAAVGLTTLLLARYTGLAAPFWPAAGIAFALVYQRGRLVAIGVAAGSFAVNAWTLASERYELDTILLTAGLIAAGAALQALAGAALVERRLGRHVGLIRAGQISWFLILAGPVACLVNSSVGVTAQLITGVISSSEALLGWMTWWAGDSIGVIVAAPIALMLMRDQDDVWHDRRWKVAAPSLVVTMVLLAAFVANRDLEERRVDQRERTIAAEAKADLVASLAIQDEALHGIAGLFEASESVTAAEFRAYTRTPLQRHESLHALSWNQYVPRSELASFEQAQRSQPGLGRYQVTERDAAGELAPVGRRPAYVPVTYIEPLATNRAALGFDILSNPDRAVAIEAAIVTAQMRSTAPIDLVQESGKQKGMLTLLPIYDQNLVPFTVGERRKEIAGFAVGVYRLGDLVSQTYASTSWAGVDIVLRDITAEAEPVQVGEHRAPLGDRPGDPRAEVFDVNGRTWQLVATAGTQRLEDVRTTNIPGLLLAGVLIIGLLEAFLLLVTGLERQARRDAETSSYAAEHDPLTDLYNRRGFRRALRSMHERAAHEGAVHFLMFLDLDGFKAVNDLGGHDAGDALLQLIAGEMQRGVRRRDVVARLGGDEFGIILDDCGVERGLAIARQIVTAVSDLSVRAGDADLSVRVSVGAVPVVGPNPPPPDELVSLADEACYAAKRAGGGVMLAASPNPQADRTQDARSGAPES